MAYTYVAIKAGVLSNPYRFLEKGERYVSPVKLNRSWLVPESEYRQRRELPITSAMPHGPKREIARETKPIDDPQYDQAVSDLKESWNAEEAEAAKKLNEVVEAIGGLTEDDYTRYGKPKTEALQQLIDRPVSAAERDKAFDVYQQKQDSAGETEETKKTEDGTGNQDVLG
nr:hypothetical protein 7 [bacterium]